MITELTERYTVTFDLPYGGILTDIEILEIIEFLQGKFCAINTTVKRKGV